MILCGFYNSSKNVLIYCHVVLGDQLVNFCKNQLAHYQRGLIRCVSLLVVMPS